MATLLELLQQAAGNPLAAGLGLLGLLSGAYVLYVFAAWYRLRQFPGPFLASISHYWLFRAMATGRIHRVILEEQRKYGKIMRVGPNELMVYDNATLWHINGARSKYTRGAWYKAMRMDPFDSALLSEMDTVKHDKLKAKLVGGYNGKGTMDLERDVDTQLDVLVNLIKTKYVSSDAATSKIMDFSKIARYFTIDTITLAGLGEAWGNLRTESDVFGFMAFADAYMPAAQILSMSPTARNIVHSPTFLRLAGPRPGDGSPMGQSLGVSKAIVEKRFKEGPPPDRQYGDMLDEWIKQGLSPRECELSISLQVPAGSETTTTAIRTTMLYLITAPVVYQKLKAEIAAAIREGRISSPATAEEGKKLPFLQAVLNEGIRMLPPAVTGFPKRVPAGGDTLCGQFVPAGTDIFTNAPLVLRDPEVFGGDADLFRPERFLECSPEKKAAMLKTVELVFGHGRWMCPGKMVAWMELNKIFIELLRRFHFHLVNPQKPWTLRTYSSVNIDDLFVRVSDDPLD